MWQNQGTLRLMRFKETNVSKLNSFDNIIEISVLIDINKLN